MAEDGMAELCDKLVPLLREYDLEDSIMALSFQLASAIYLAGKATRMGKELKIALEYAEKKTFLTNEVINKILYG